MGMMPVAWRVFAVTVITGETKECTRESKKIMRTLVVLHVILKVPITFAQAAR